MKKKFIYLIACIVSLAACNDNRGIPTPVEQGRPAFEQMISPLDSAFAFDRTEPLTMRFTEPMDANSFPGNFHLWQGEFGMHEINGNFTAEDNDVIFYPNSALSPAKQYYTELGARVQDINGNGIDKESLFVMSSEFFTDGENSTDSLLEYFVCNGFNDVLQKISIEMQRLKSEDVLAISGFGRQLEMAFTLDGSYLIMSDYNTTASGIYFINPNNYQIELKLTENPGTNPAVSKSAEIAMSSSFAYVTNQSNKLISVVDLSSKTITAAVSVSGTPKGLALTPDGTKLFVGSGTDNKVWVINTVNNTVENTLVVDGLTRSVRLAVSPDGQYLIIREFLGTKIFFVEISSGDLLSSLDVGYKAKSGNNNDLAVVNDDLFVSSSEALLKISISSRQIIAENNELNFQGLDVEPFGEVLLAAIRDDPAKMAVILPENFKIIRLLDIGGSVPWDVAIRPATGN